MRNEPFILESGPTAEPSKPLPLAMPHCMLTQPNTAAFTEGIHSPLRRHAG